MVKDLNQTVVLVPNVGTCGRFGTQNASHDKHSTALNLIVLQQAHIKFTFVMELLVAVFLRLLKYIAIMLVQL